MIAKTTPKFWQHYASLPVEIRRLADRAYVVWKDDPGHGSLHFKKLEGHEALWSVRIGRQYRAAVSGAGTAEGRSRGVGVDRASRGIRSVGGVRETERGCDEFSHRQHRLSAVLDLVSRRATGVQDGRG